MTVLLMQVLPVLVVMRMSRAEYQVRAVPSTPFS